MRLDLGGDWRFVGHRPAFGGIFENMVVSEMRKKRLNAGLRGDMYFIRDQNGREGVDARGKGVVE